MSKIDPVGPRKVDYHWAFPLVKVEFQVLGCYISGKWLPERMRFLHPQVIRDFARLQESTNCQLVYSDMWRSFQESLNARRQKGAGLVAYPGNSGHNWGVSFDIDVENSCVVLESQEKIARGLDRRRRMLAFYDWMSQFNFAPMTSVREKFEAGKRSVSEEWHFNHSIIGDMAVKDWAGDNYGEDLQLNVEQIQACLNELGYGIWPIDGQLSDMLTKAVIKFQKDYDLDPDGDPGPITQRTLACFCASIDLMKAPYLNNLELFWEQA